MALVAKRPLSIFRRDSDAAAPVGAGATIDSGMAPCKGYDALTIYMRITEAGGGTIRVLQRLRANSTFGITDTFALAGAGRVSTVVAVTGEHIRVEFVNGADAQRPEIICTLT